MREQVEARATSYDGDPSSDEWPPGLLEDLGVFQPAPNPRPRANWDPRSGPHPKPEPHPHPKPQPNANPGQLPER